jgi:hypothetical protein
MDPVQAGFSAAAWTFGTRRRASSPAVPIIHDHLRADSWDRPADHGNVPFLVTDTVLLAVPSGCRSRT